MEDILGMIEKVESRIITKDEVIFIKLKSKCPYCQVKQIVDAIHKILPENEVMVFSCDMDYEIVKSETEI